jgi:hypothetical protein
MGRKRTIIIAPETKCPDCGEHKDLRGAGHGWRDNPDGDEPKRMRFQRFLCNVCGKSWLSNQKVEVK